MTIARGILVAHWPSLCTDQREEGLSTNSQVCKEEIALGVIVLRWKPNSKIEREKAGTSTGSREDGSGHLLSHLQEREPTCPFDYRTQ